MYTYIYIHTQLKTHFILQYFDSVYLCQVKYTYNIQLYKLKFEL